jgi:hypothetical protein
MTTGPPCCRCGGPTRLNNYGLGVCNRGRARRTCGFWWRRDHGCQWNWSNLGLGDGPVTCPGGCRWDHRVEFMPTHTTSDGREHLYHSPEKWCRSHSLLAVVRPKVEGARRWYAIPLGPSTDNDKHPITRRAFVA